MQSIFPTVGVATLLLVAGCRDAPLGAAGGDTTADPTAAPTTN